jgi:hypothetical protein
MTGYVTFLYSGPTKTVLFEGLQEKNVGITEFTTSTTGMSGILKHRLIEIKQIFILVLIFQ